MNYFKKKIKYTKQSIFFTKKLQFKLIYGYTALTFALPITSSSAIS